MRFLQIIFAAWGGFGITVTAHSDNEKDIIAAGGDVTNLYEQEWIEFERQYHEETMTHRTLQDCNQEIKQKSIYATFEFEPSLKNEPVLDVIGDVFWDNIDDMRRHGKNGIFHAFPVGFGSKVPGGYFGPQATGANGENVEQVLFSLWDYKRYGQDGWQPALPFLVTDNIENCDTFDAKANPGQACCKRNCNDCSQSQSTGTQCKVFIPAKSGMHLRLNIYRYLTEQTLEYEGETWTGDVWAVDIYNMITKERFPVGKQLLSGTSDSGIDRITNFLEHIGCTPCDSFDQYTSRAGPWVLKTRSPGVDTILVSAHSKFDLSNPPFICTNHAIDSSGAPFIKFSSGPSIPYLDNGDATWDKTLYTCECDDRCKTPTDPKVVLCDDTLTDEFLGDKTCLWLASWKGDEISIRDMMCEKYASTICPHTCKGLCGCNDKSNKFLDHKKNKERKCSWLLKKGKKCKNYPDAQIKCPDTCAGWCS